MRMFNNRRLRGRGLKDQDGGTLLEMALVLPPFFLLLFGLFEFSIVLMGYCSATYACRVGARYASLHSTTSLAPCNAACLTSLVTAQMWAPSGTVSVSAPTYTPSNTVGSTVKVSVTVAYPTALAVISTATITISGTAQRTIMR
jgi:Flp pilus assembly protein TadG